MVVSMVTRVYFVIMVGLKQKSHVACEIKVRSLLIEKVLMVP